MKNIVTNIGYKLVFNNFIRKILSPLGIKLSIVSPQMGYDEYIKLFSHESIENKRFYNISAGGHVVFGAGFSHPFWRNLDYMHKIEGWDKTFDPKKDIVYDMLNMEPLPIESNTAEIILCQYSIEHIPDNVALFFMKEVYRVLKPGGIFRVVTPNAELDYLAYINKDESYFVWKDAHSQSSTVKLQGYKEPLNKVSFEKLVMAHFTANVSENHVGNNHHTITDNEFKEIMHRLKMEEALEYCTSRCDVTIQQNYRFNHMNWWTHKKAFTFLEKAGFNKNYILAPNQSNLKVLRDHETFDKLWNYVALYIEARKDF